MPCPPLNGALVVTKRKRILLWVGATFGVLFVYLWLFGIQTGFALMAWKAGLQVPQVKDVPIALKDSAVNNAPGTQFSCAGYEFELPRTDVDDVKHKIGGCLISCKSGVRVSFNTEPARAFVKNVASKSGGEESLRRSYGDEVVSSDYNFYRLMLTTTPSSVKPLGSRQSATHEWVLLILKAVAMPDPGRSGVYSLRTTNFQGFQYGTPGNAARYVISDLLDDKGNAEFVFVDVPGQTPRITQADINRATQSLRRTSISTDADAETSQTSTFPPAR
jgi:hypothetical protein